MPVAINRAKYASAQVLIRENVWRVDGERGLVFGISGRPFAARLDGYVYGTLPCSTTQVFVHRVLWESLHGEIPDGVEINHRNGVRHDNQPANLELVTHSGNAEHAIRTGAWSPRRGEDHGMARLTARQACEIYSRSWGGESHQALAQEFAVSAGHVKRIRLGLAWTHATAAIPVAKPRRRSNSRLTEDEVDAIRVAVASGETQKSVASRYGIAKSTLSGIVNHKAWV